MDALERLRGLVLADGALQADLRGRTEWDDLVAAATALAAEAGFSITPDELLAGRRAATRSWIEQDFPSALPERLDEVIPHGWTPVGFSPEAVQWCDLRGMSLRDPFFLDTVQRALWEPYRLLFRPRTSLAALEAVATRIGPARPAGLILHTSRCGSTLVCQMLGAVPGTLALSEPVPCDQALRAHGASVATRARWLRWLLAALGADGAVVKLDAWNIHQRDVVREALPGVPWIFLYRDPAEILASQAHTPGVIMVPGMLPAEIFELDSETVLAMTPEEYGARVLSSICETALEQLDDDCRLVGYTDLPDAVLTDVAAHFGLPTGEVEVALMRDAARPDAKRPNEGFDAVAAARSRPVSAAIRDAAARWAAPAVAELERRKLAWP